MGCQTAGGPSGRARGKTHPPADAPEEVYGGPNACALRRAREVRDPLRGRTKVPWLRGRFAS